MDPLAEAFDFQSTFAYAANNPISNVDILGMAAASAEDQEKFEMAKKLGTTIYSAEESKIDNDQEPNNLSQTDPLKANSRDAKPVEEWAEKYKGSSLLDIKYETTVLSDSNGNSKSGGSDPRYVLDPKNGNVIDMKHFLKVGQWEASNGKWVGSFIEWIQEGKYPQSAHHPQDYYSNELGRQFFQKHKVNTLFSGGTEHHFEFPNGITNAVIEFLNNRE